MMRDAANLDWSGILSDKRWHRFRQTSRIYPGGCHERWQDTFHPNNGLPAVDNFHSIYRMVWWRSRCLNDDLRRAVSRHSPCQLTYRKSLQDIKVYLGAQAGKLYHMGFRRPVKRSTPVEGNESRNRWIYATFGQHLIAQAHDLYIKDNFGLDSLNTVYVFDSATIDLCLPVFPWMHRLTTKTVVKIPTLLDLKGNIPSLLHISDSKMADVHALDSLQSAPGVIFSVRWLMQQSPKVGVGVAR